MKSNHWFYFQHSDNCFFFTFFPSDKVLFFFFISKALYCLFSLIISQFVQNILLIGFWIFHYNFTNKYSGNVINSTNHSTALFTKCIYNNIPYQSQSKCTDRKSQQFVAESKNIMFDRHDKTGNRVSVHKKKYMNLTTTALERNQVFLSLSQALVTYI